MIAEPKVASFLCSVDFLKALVEWKIAKGHSMRMLSGRCGFKSPNYLQLLITKKRQLSAESVSQISQGFGLSSEDTDAFLLLFQRKNFTHPMQTKADEVRQKVKLSKLRAHLKQEQSHILKEWWALLLRELTFLPSFREDAEYLESKVEGRVSGAVLQEGLKRLVAAGLLKRNSNGKLEACNPVLDTGDFCLSRELLSTHHKKNLEVWAKFLEEKNSGMQERGLLNIPLTAEKCEELRKKIRDFQDEIMGWAEEIKKPTGIAQLGVYLFPMGFD